MSVKSDKARKDASCESRAVFKQRIATRVDCATCARLLRTADTLTMAVGWCRHRRDTKEGLSQEPRDEEVGEMTR